MVIKSMYLLSGFPKGISVLILCFFVSFASCGTYSYIENSNIDHVYNND